MVLLLKVIDVMWFYSVVVLYMVLGQPMRPQKAAYKGVQNLGGHLIWISMLRIRKKMDSYSSIWILICILGFSFG